MTLRGWRYGLAAALAFALGLLGVAGGSEPWAQGQPACTVTVKPGESIQRAIDAAAEGAVICLTAGTWEENVEIKKSLTLRGASREQTKIRGKKEGEPVIMIKSDAEIEVTIEGFTIAEAKRGSGIDIGGTARATITNSQISGNEGMGISMWGTAQATITNSQISNERSSFYVGVGISMWDSTQATITNSQVSGNEGAGISMWGSAQATITNSQISGNGYDGIEMRGSAQATIENNTIQENKVCGIWSSSDKPAQGKGNRMRGNGADLCGNAPAGLRIPLVPPTSKTQLSFPGPYPTLQEAIDALAPGGVIAIAAGEHLGGLTIWKPLTLRGAGREEVKLKGAVSLISEAQGVQIEGVTITDSAFTGLLLGGQAKATITNSQISGNEGNGISIMWDSAQVTITNSQISGNEGNGIIMEGSAQVTITDSQISGNEENGIRMGDSTQATITNSKISGSEIFGIIMGGSAWAEIKGSIIEGNGTHEGCKNNYYMCNGIGLYEKPQVKIIDSTIRNNADWGVGAALKQCGYWGGSFTGAVTFEDMMLDQIAGNNTSGNQNGMGNPGNHYWNRPDIPDGQVCLP
jgi:parallel beta-helix repeat protein